MQLSAGEGVNDPQAAVRALSVCHGRSSATYHLPERPEQQKGPSRAPADRVERIQSGLRSQASPPRRGRARPASVPPLRAGGVEEMAVRVAFRRRTCADPPCVSALLCRCQRAEHPLRGARWWRKDSNLRAWPSGPVPGTSRRPHQVGRCVVIGRWVVVLWLADSRRSSRPLIPASAAPDWPVQARAGDCLARPPTRPPADTTSRGRHAVARRPVRAACAVGGGRDTPSTVALSAPAALRQKTKNAHDALHVGTPTPFLARPVPGAQAPIFDVSMEQRSLARIIHRD